MLGGILIGIVLTGVAAGFWFWYSGRGSTMLAGTVSPPDLERLKNWWEGKIRSGAALPWLIVVWLSLGIVYVLGLAVPWVRYALWFVGFPFLTIGFIQYYRARIKGRNP